VTDSIGLAGRASPGSSSRQDLTTAEVLPACSLMIGVDVLPGIPRQATEGEDSRWRGSW